MYASELAGSVHEKVDALSRELGSDLKTFELPPKPSLDSLKVVGRALMEIGLSGKVILYGANSRGMQPVGVIMNGVNGEVSPAVGVYIPTSADRKITTDPQDLQIRIDLAMTEKVTTARKARSWVPFKGGLVVADKGMRDYWENNRMFPTVIHTSHESEMSPAELAGYKAEGELFMGRYVKAMYEAIALLGMYGITPETLMNPNEPIVQAGDMLSVYVSAFTLTDHSSVREYVVERDDWRCVLPRITLLGNGWKEGNFPTISDIPTCNRNVKGYFPEVGNALYMVDYLRNGQWEANHAEPRGVVMPAGVMAAWYELIPESIFDDSELLLLALGSFNLGELATRAEVNLVESKERLLRMAAKSAPKVERATNFVGHLGTMCLECHRGIYHPDLAYMYELAGALNEIILHRENPPLTTLRTYPDWVNKMTDRTLAGDFRFRGDFDVAMGLLHQARMLVGIAKQPYWRNEFTDVLLHLTLQKTRHYIEQEVEKRTVVLLGELARLRHERGGGVELAPEIEAVVLKIAGLRQEVKSGLSPKRRGHARADRVLKRYGLEPEEDLGEEVE